MINWNPQETTTEDLIATVARADQHGADFAAACTEMNRRCGEGSWRKYSPVRSQSNNSPIPVSPANSPTKSTPNRD